MSEEPWKLFNFDLNRSSEPL